MKIRKIVLGIVLLGAVLFAFCGVNAFADSQYSAQLSDSRNAEEWYFDQSSGTLTIRKQGVLIDYTPLDAFDAPWAGKKGQVNTLKIESGITNIGDWSFLSLVSITPGQGIKTLYLPKSVTRIGDGAFEFFFDLSDVYYEGSREEWEKLTEDVDYIFLEAANKHYLTDSSQFSGDGSSNLTVFAGKKSNPFYNAEVGDLVSFGQYEQDDNYNNGKEEITWRVLARDQNRILVISELALDCQPYHRQSHIKITWEKCDLRRWLNDNFLNSAFTLDQKAVILLSDVSADKNPDSEADPGMITQDRVFLLSIKEVEYYFSTPYSRFCIPTAYAVAQGSKAYPEINTCWWWTRTPGCDNFYVSDVYGDGTINYIGGPANQNELSVRPAMWIDINT